LQLADHIYALLPGEMIGWIRQIQMSFWRHDIMELTLLGKQRREVNAWISSKATQTYEGTAMSSQLVCSRLGSGETSKFLVVEQAKKDILSTSCRNSEYFLRRKEMPAPASHILMACNLSCIGPSGR
jgi:hypothetical protein